MFDYIPGITVAAYARDERKLMKCEVHASTHFEEGVAKCFLISY